jgi:hypothetical protein
MSTNTNTKNDYPKEWEECLKQMDKFDGYLNEARKYGFTLITGLTTASSFLGFSDAANTIQLGVIIATMVLVFVLYLVDTYYRRILNRMLLRALKIEEVNIKGRKLAHYFSRIYREGITSKMILGVYVGFIGALAILGYYAITAAESQGNNSNISPIGLVQALEVQEGNHPLSMISRTAYLWIPLVITIILITSLLLKIFPDQGIEKQHVDAAMKVIENARQRLQNYEPPLQTLDETKDDVRKREMEWSLEDERIESDILNALEGKQETSSKNLNTSPSKTGAQN